MKFILTADWHIRGDKPRCRTDENWLLTQADAISSIVEYANNSNLPIFIAGDLFNTPRVATAALYMCIEQLQQCITPIYILAGNHDLPYHSYDNLNDSSIGVLSQCFTEINKANIPNVDGFPFGLDDSETGGEIVFSHQLVFPNEKARPMGCKDLGRTADEVLDQFPNAQIVCVGDYHHSFVHERDGRFVINPGCMLRQVADMKDYKCSFYVVDTEAKTFEKALIPDAYENVTDEYLREAEVSEAKISAFVEAIKTGKNVSLDFRANLESALLECADVEVKSEINTMIQTIYNEVK